MKVYTVTAYRTCGPVGNNLLGIYTTAVRAKEACWQAAEGWAKPDESVESTEDGNTLSIKIGETKFCVDEHETYGA
jgi:hypothetical protein